MDEQKVNMENKATLAVIILTLSFRKSMKRVEVFHSTATQEVVELKRGHHKFLRVNYKETFTDAES